MEKKSKKSIVIVITSLVLVTLLLLGLTYAYYRTRIIGNNSNEPSISVQSKKMEITYHDGNAVLSTEGLIEPGFTATKEFSVENTGDETTTFSIFLDNVINEFNKGTKKRGTYYDWKYYLYSGSEVNVSNLIKEGEITTESTQYLIESVSINVSETKQYLLKVEYKYLEDVDQSLDMGSKFSLRVNIGEEYQDDEYQEIDQTLDTAEEGTLLYAIKRDNIVTEPKTIPGQSANAADEAVLASTEDDYGTSYYFRGNVQNNYVNFAGMCWRIVRIAGDGTTKLILEDQNQPCSTSINGDWGFPTTGGSTYTGNFGYTRYNKNTLTASDGTKNSYSGDFMDYLHGQTNSARSMATAFKNFQSTFTETELSKLKSGNWCLGDAGYSRTGSSNSDYTYTLLNETQMMDNKIKGTSFDYDSYVRLGRDNKDGYQPTLKCNGTIMNDWDDDTTNPTPMYVGGITADEMVYAGGKAYSFNNNFYLLNDSFKNGNFDFFNFWSLSPYFFSGVDDYAFFLNGDGHMNFMNVNDINGAFRPAVSLKSGSVITEGVGTLEKPYIIG